MLTALFRSLLSMERTFDTHAAILWAQDNVDVPIFAVAAYLVTVFYVPKYISTGIKLRGVWSLWNLLLSAFSILGASRTVPHLVAAVRNEGVAYTLCKEPETWYLRGETGFWVTMFIFSKIPELLDTVFLVLQNKEVIFLHWFHHVTVLLYCWHAFISDTATGLWFCAINYSVHAIMYFYYFLSITGGPLRSYARPIAPYITTVQLVQMVVGSSVTVGAGVLNGRDAAACPINRANYRLALAMYMSYFFLFAVLFYNLYLKPTGKHARKRAQGSTKAKEGEQQAAVDEKICGVDLKKGDAGGFFHSYHAKKAPASSKPHAQ